MAPPADADEHALWHDGMRLLRRPGAARALQARPGHALGSMAPDVLRPWIEEALALFGTDRCFFASNFPVDGLPRHRRGCGRRTRPSPPTWMPPPATPFAGNAERAYRL